MPKKQQKKGEWARAGLVPLLRSLQFLDSCAAERESHGDVQLQENSRAAPHQRFKEHGQRCSSKVSVQALRGSMALPVELGVSAGTVVIH